MNFQGGAPDAEEFVVSTRFDGAGGLELRFTYARVPPDLEEIVARMRDRGYYVETAGRELLMKTQGG